MSRDPINWVICAAGIGARFAEVGVLTPKPLIKMSGMTMLERSVHALPCLPGDRLIIITQKQHNIISIKKQIQALHPHCVLFWIELDGQTKGQLDTALRARPHLEMKYPIAIWNCDTYFKSIDFEIQMRDPSIEAIIPSGKMPGNSWSFVEIENGNEVISVVEKKRISPWATVGMYYFRNTALFLKYAKSTLKKKPRLGEHYVSDIYPEYLKKFHRVSMAKTDSFLPYGTPEQVKKYWGITTEEMLTQNPNGTIVVDLDETITKSTKNKDYKNSIPNKKLIALLKKYKGSGYSIIIYTARNMKTTSGDESKIMANVGLTTLEWLKKHKVPFDGIRFAKPYAENAFYIDDKAIRPTEFVELNAAKLMQLLKKK